MAKMLQTNSASSLEGTNNPPRDKRDKYESFLRSLSPAYKYVLQLSHLDRFDSFLVTYPYMVVATSVL